MIGKRYYPRGSYMERETVISHIMIRAQDWQAFVIAADEVDADLDEGEREYGVT